MTEPLLTAHQLGKRFTLKESPFTASTTLLAVDDVSFSLRKGETLGCAGESGCGKSTLAKMIMGLEDPSAGEVLFRGRNMAGFNRSEMNRFRQSVQMVFQDPYSSLNPRMRVGDIIGEPLIIHNMLPGLEHRDRIIRLMEQVGLPAETYDRYPHEFSGGQRQRIGIARALALAPEVIVADEPLSALDISIQAQIINLLLDLQESLGLSYFIISHDLAVIRHLSTRVLIMYLGRIVEEAETEQLFSSPHHPYTEALLSAVPEFAPRGTPPPALKGDLPSPLAQPSGCPFHPRCPYRQEICSTVVPQLAEKRPGHFSACHFSSRLFTEHAAGASSTS